MAAGLAIAVCGCGPAGLAAALLLTRTGHRVRLFERFEQARPVGSGLILQPTGLAVLAELDLFAAIAALGARIDRLFGRVIPSNRVVLDVRYRLASRMAGVLPIGRRSANEPACAAFFWSLRRSDLDAWRKRGLPAWHEEVIALWPEVAPLVQCLQDADQLTFAQYEHFTLARPYDDRLVHIGDSAHATSPQLGQGANMALLDALALSRALTMTTDVCRALPLYARMRRWHVRLFQFASAIFTPFYQSDSWVLPFVRDQLTAPLSRLPLGEALLARLVAGMTTSPLSGQRLAPVDFGLIAGARTSRYLRRFTSTSLPGTLPCDCSEPACPISRSPARPLCC